MPEKPRRSISRARSRVALLRPGTAARATAGELAHHLDHVDHVERVLLEGEPAASRVDHEGVAGHLVVARVAAPAGQPVHPACHDAILFDHGPLMGKAPAVEAGHALHQELLDLAPPFDATPGGVDERGVVGEEAGQRIPGELPGLDTVARSDVALVGGADLLRGKLRHVPSDWLGIHHTPGMTSETR
jgi:hypothetical protein